MKAVLLHGYGDVTQLTYEDVPAPTPGPGEVLVAMAATSINPVDWKIRRGDMRARASIEFPLILGRDIAGTVVELGLRVTSLKVGDRVMGLVTRAYAECVVCKADDLALIPAKLDFAQAAALPLVAVTGAQLIELGVRPKSGDTILVTGALGGVGRAAVHVALQHGANVIAGVRSAQRSHAMTLGAERVIALDDPGEVAGISELDAIADTVGHDVIAALFPRIKQEGVFATVVGIPEAAHERSDVRAEQVWAHPDAARLERLAVEVANGTFSLPIGRQFKLSEIRAADALAEAGGAGKIVLLA